MLGSQGHDRQCKRGLHRSTPSGFVEFPKAVVFTDGGLALRLFQFLDFFFPLLEGAGEAFAQAGQLALDEPNNDDREDSQCTEHQEQYRHFATSEFGI